MNVTVFIAFVFAPLLAVCTFFALRQTLITVHISVFIRAPTTVVFDYVKEPRNLPLANPVIRSLEVTNETVVKDGVEYREWTSMEELPHIGLLEVKVVSLADQAKQTIHITTAPFYGMVVVAVTYSLETATRGAVSGTLFTERSEIYVPRILQNFTNKTTVEAHTEILQNYKFLLESDSTEPRV